MRDVLGSPLLTDLFHADRWDYVFTIRRQGAEPQPRAIVVLFDGDRLKSIETGGDLPSEREFVASIDTGNSSRSVPSAGADRRTAQGAAAAATPAADRGRARRRRAHLPAARDRRTMTLARTGTVETEGRLRVAVAGASGRMGRMLIEAVGASADCVLAGALDAADSPALGQDATPATPGARRRRRSRRTCAQGSPRPQVLIDFTRPEGTLAHVAALPRARRPPRDRHDRLHRRAEGRRSPSTRSTSRS